MVRLQRGVWFSFNRSWSFKVCWINWSVRTQRVATDPQITRQSCMRACPNKATPTRCRVSKPRKRQDDMAESAGARVICESPEVATRWVRNTLRLIQFAKWGSWELSNCPSWDKTISWKDVIYRLSTSQNLPEHYRILSPRALYRLC